MIGAEAATIAQVMIDQAQGDPTWWRIVSWLAVTVLQVGWLALTVWMAVYCVRRDPNRLLWIWLIVLIQPVGPIIYFLARYLPTAQIAPPAFLRRFTNRSHIRRLEIAARQIGNSHQYLEWGDALRNNGRWEEACVAYRTAVEKDRRSLPALWGLAQCEFRAGQFTSARERLATVLDEDPGYKFGDVSLLYAKSLIGENQQGAARGHLEDHIRRWRTPEAVYLLAKLCEQMGDEDLARRHAQDLLADLEASPPAIARRHAFWRSRAKRLLRRVGQPVRG